MILLGVESIIASERKFAETTGKIGIRDGFLAFLARDSILLTPRIVNGWDHYESMSQSTGTLQWGPEIVESSLSGMFGLSTGPYCYSAKSADGVVKNSYGRFFSLWKVIDNEWKVVFDAGLSTVEEKKIPKNVIILKHREASTNVPVLMEGIPDGIAPTIVLHDGKEPFFGEWDERFPPMIAEHSWVTPENDMGFCCGYVNTDGSVNYSVLRVFVRGEHKEWLVRAEVRLPVS